MAVHNNDDKADCEAILQQKWWIKLDTVGSSVTGEVKYTKQSPLLIVAMNGFPFNEWAYVHVGHIFQNLTCTEFAKFSNYLHWNSTNFNKTVQRDLRMIRSYWR